MNIIDFELLKNRIDEIVAEPNCKICYGRGVIGRDVKTGKKILCRCVMKKAKELLIDEYKKQNNGKNKSKKNSADTCGEK